MNEQYKRAWGPNALVPERTEPFPLWALHTIFAALLTGSILSSSLGVREISLKLKFHEIP